MSTKRYTLDAAGRPTPASNVEEWDAFISNLDQRIVARSLVTDLSVDTYFTGVSLGDPPMLWQTDVHTLSDGIFTKTYASLREAQEGHVAIVTLLLKEESEEYLAPTFVSDHTVEVLRRWAKS
jgi:hypothetical protein